jgi:hypothetical protein
VLASVADTVLRLSHRVACLSPTEYTKNSSTGVESYYINLGVVCAGGRMQAYCVKVRGRIGLGQIWPYNLSKSIAVFGIFCLPFSPIYTRQPFHMFHFRPVLFNLLQLWVVWVPPLSVLLPFAIYRAPSSLPSTLGHVRGSISQRIELSRPRTYGTPLVRLFIFQSSRRSASDLSLFEPPRKGLIGEGIMLQYRASIDCAVPIRFSLRKE